MPKRSPGYVDCKVYHQRINGDFDRKMVGIDFGNLRLRDLASLIPDEDHVESHHREVSYLLREVGHEIRRQLGVVLCPMAIEPAFVNKTVRLEFPVKLSEVTDVKQRIRAILNEVYELNATVTK